MLDQLLEKVVLPIAVLIIIILILAAILLFVNVEKESSSPPSFTNGTIQNRPTGEMEYTGRKFNRQSISEIIKYYYWMADAPVREFLRRKGWKWFD